MWIGVLGPLLVEHRGAQIELKAAKLRILLAALLAQPNRVVSNKELAEALWQTEPPASAQVTARNYVKRLRETLGSEGAERVVTRAPGYLIEVSEAEYDLLAFERLCQYGRVALRSSRWQQAADAYDEALALWRGEPLSDVPSPALHAGLVPHISELRLQALESRLQARLELGAGGELIADLRRMTAEHPLRERFHTQFMLALARGGRQAEALAIYQETHRRLTSELGIEPGPELREIHARILRGEAELLEPAPVSEVLKTASEARVRTPDTLDGTVLETDAQVDDIAKIAAPVLLPRQLPSAPRYFTGRADEIKILDELIFSIEDPVGGHSFAPAADFHAGRWDPRPADAAGPIAVVTGMAGIGKTALALHWAHRAADRFPDGQLYINLRGYAPTGRPVTPSEAIATLLDALGVDATMAPSGLSAQAALYRSLLSRRRVLIVLDNAADADQIRPLLPGAAGCAVLVTSRDRMAGLAAADGAHLLNLDLLDEGESCDLLNVRLRAERIVADPVAVDSLAGLCAGLPLALSIVAAHAAMRAHLPLAALAADLGAARSRLDGLDLGDPAADVRAAIFWSYRSLSPTAARMFRLLGVHPGPDISGAAAASLAGVSPEAARAVLRELTRGNLLAEQRPNRFALHDLLRSYAAEQVAADPDGMTDHHEAIHRVLDHYLRTGEAAAGLVDPTREPLPLPESLSGVAPEPIADAESAGRWFESEHAVLLASVGAARSLGFLEHAWQLPCMMTVFLDRCGYWHEWVASASSALDAAEELGNDSARARIHRNLAFAHSSLGAYDQARQHYTCSLLLCRTLGDNVSQAHAHRGLAAVAEVQGRERTSLAHGRRALVLYTDAGHAPGRAQAMNDVGWSYAKLGAYDKGIEYCNKALRLMRDLGDEDGQAAAHDSLGYIHRRRGEHAASAECYWRALTVYRRIGDTYRQARTLMRIAEGEGNDPATARVQYRQALVILAKLGRAPEMIAVS